MVVVVVVVVVAVAVVAVVVVAVVVIVVLVVVVIIVAVGIVVVGVVVVVVIVLVVGTNLIQALCLCRTCRKQFALKVISCRLLGYRSHAVSKTGKARQRTDSNSPHQVF